MASNLELVEAAIQTAAVSGIASVKIGNEEVVTKNLAELLEWRKELIGQQAASGSGFGLRITRCIPPGCG
jgi:hypothetical protein